MAGQSVSVLGLGAMGSAFAHALLDGGHAVTVWNRTAARAAPLVAAGAKHATTPAGALAGADVAVLIVPHYADVREILGSDGAPTELRGTVVVNLTTGQPEEAAEMDAWLAGQGAEYLDGRVGAYPDGVGTGHSNTFYSGPFAAFERARPALESMGSDCRLVAEDIRAANALAFSMVTVFHHLALGGFYEAAALASRFGLPAAEWRRMAGPILELTREAIERGGEQIEAGDYAGELATLDIHAEALYMAEEAMIDLGAEHALTSVMARYFDRARGRGLGGSEVAAVFEVLRAPR